MGDGLNAQFEHPSRRCPPILAKQRQSYPLQLFDRSLLGGMQIPTVHLRFKNDSAGIEPGAKQYLLLKSRIHYRAGFQPIARHIVECDGVGVTSSDYGQFRFENIRRPIFPLD